MGSIISNIIMDSDYRIDQFNQKEIDELEKLVFTKKIIKVKKFLM